MKKLSLSVLSFVLIFGVFFTAVGATGLGQHERQMNLSIEDIELENITDLSGQAAEIVTEDIQSEVDANVVSKELDITVTNLIEENLKDIATQSIPPIMQYATTYNFSNRDIGNSVIQSNDGGYVILGETHIYGDTDLLFLKVDSSFNIVWAYAYGTELIEDPADVRQTSDGGYIIGGTRVGGGASDIFLIKTDANGVIEWSNTYGGPADERAYALEIGHDGGYILAGTKMTSSGSTDAYLLKVASNGFIQWNRSFGVNQISMTEEFSGVSPTTDGGYVAVGSKMVQTGFGSFQSHGSVVKVSGNGTPAFTSTLAHAVFLEDVVAAGNGFIATGTIYVQPGGNIYVVRMTNSGGINWTEQFSATIFDTGVAITPAIDGNYVITGFTTPLVGQENLLLMKINNAGNAVWSSIIDFGTSSEIGRSVDITFDGGYIVTGPYRLNNLSDVLLVKFSMD
ncbi:hypothetical protein [Bacillus horti]|uniref:Bulb-type lectin domain-containing protein n=1 Tax=Caldalkalibacillus horti TaxID=77523 RepID=A0ABT9VWL0_9BACI|nr:hypothetical protein [Bacillus horti]MDQ0165363.1 hypothetical protein [Bacillus horti]